MIHAAAYGRLGQDPRPVETKTGTPMTLGTIAVEILDRSAGDHPPPLWLGLVAFGRQAEILARHGKGDLVSVSGRVQRNTWTAPDGTTREQLQLVADAVVSARSVRPGGGRKKTTPSTRGDR